MAKHDNHMKCVKHPNHIKSSNQNKVRSLKQKQQRINEYNQNPTQCKNCNDILDYSKRMNLFCSRSCSTKYNNMNRVRKQYTISSDYIEKRKTKHKEKYLNDPKLCKECLNAIPYDLRKTNFCSDICRSIFRSKIAKTKSKIGGNKNRKADWYESKIAGKVWLESSYELSVAKDLDVHNINWIRPKFIKWKDNDDVEHKYFPDFYLVDYDIYLDPKNNFLQKQDKLKITLVQQQNNVRILVLNKFQLKWNVIKTLI